MSDQPTPRRAHQLTHAQWKAQLFRTLEMVVDKNDPRPKSVSEQWDIMVREKELTKREPS